MFGKQAMRPATGYGTSAFPGFTYTIRFQLRSYNRSHS